MTPALGFCAAFVGFCMGVWLMATLGNLDKSQAQAGWDHVCMATGHTRSVYDGREWVCVDTEKSK